MLKKTFEYLDGNTVLEAFVAYNDAISKKRPAILIAHDWSGRNEFACKKAEKLAELGYVGFALDMYGKNKIAKTKEEKMAYMTPFINDRALLAKRMLAALDAIKKIEVTDPTRIGGIGFCFGGLCILDLARTGADIKGVVSFHGLLNKPDHENAKIIAKILALHGYSDPMVTPDQVMAFGTEMTAAKVDWQLNMYGNTQHGFTNPEAKDIPSGIVYDAKADARSWIAMKEFFKEVLA